MLIDDASGVGASRIETRRTVDEMLARPLVPLNLDDEAAVEEAAERLDETWGFSPEAIAAQDSGAWV